ncbi:MAG: transglutaminase-like domain-containing protein [Lachnospiraceae bacterium]|nr:transglutaminase-like domain-containing protein [Lachnospiraceae bacterium]
MKFENDYFKIEITKKKLTKEQKQAKRKKLKRKMPIFAACIVLILSVFLISSKLHKKVSKLEDNTSNNATQTNADMASKNNSSESSDTTATNTTEEYVNSDATYVTPISLVASTKDKYSESQFGYTYGENINGVKRGDKIEIKISYDFDEVTASLDNWDDIYRVFSDPTLTQEYRAKFEVDKEKGIITVSPTAYNANVVSTLDVDTATLNEYPHSANRFFDKNVGEDWGNLQTLYIANYFDDVTGEKLETPNVRIVNFEGELKTTPILNYSIADDGRLNLKWTEVEGASIYMICKSTLSSSGSICDTMNPIGYTSELEWCTELPTELNGVMNKDLRYFDVSEDDWYNDWNASSNEERYKERYPDIVANKGALRDTQFDLKEYICVIAMSKEGTSMGSNMIDLDLISSNLPYRTSSNFEDSNGFKKKVDDIEKIPVYDYITMCDGRVFNKLINYKTEEAKVVSQLYFNVDEDGNLLGSSDVPCLNLPYVVEGTAFAGTIVVEDYDENNLEKDAKDIEERESQIRMKGGSVSPIADTTLEVLMEETTKDVAVNDDNNIYANSALSEYLTLSMLSGKRNIDLKDFPEAKDSLQLQDAFLEAYYQNPLILGINGYNTLSNNDYIAISYDYTEEEQAQMQKEIRAKVAEISASIITDGMTDEEKEIAINEYLCSHIEYDYDALDDASNNNYRTVSDKFRNSFNAYGALVEGKCVCQGYAAAFKLLADAAGLESIMVTGMLEGEVPHAWNKVKINDVWCVIDTTNNDSEFVANALFNVPDEVSSKVLVEDDKYMLDSYIANYENKAANYEYYHLTNNYYDIAQAGEEIANKLKENEGAKIIIRTDYDMTDDDFALVCSQLYDKLGDDRELHGCHWLGVICVY